MLRNSNAKEVNSLIIQLKSFNESLIVKGEPPIRKQEKNCRLKKPLNARTQD